MIAIEKGTSLSVVLVSWIDSHISECGWEPRDEAASIELGRMVSVGFLLAQDDEVVVLSANLDRTNDCVSSTIAIPRVAVREMRIIVGLA